MSWLVSGMVSAAIVMLLVWPMARFIVRHPSVGRLRTSHLVVLHGAVVVAAWLSYFLVTPYRGATSLRGFPIGVVVAEENSWKVWFSEHDGAVLIFTVNANLSLILMPSCWLIWLTLLINKQRHDRVQAIAPESALGETRTFRTGRFEIVFFCTLTVLCLVGVVAATEMEVGYMAVFLAYVAAIVGLATVGTLDGLLTTNGDGITYELSTSRNSNFSFKWEEVAYWYFDQREEWFVRFEFRDSRKPLDISSQLFGDPSTNEFLQEVRRWLPDQERVSRIESVRWQVIVTTGGLYLSGKNLNSNFIRWPEITSWQFHPKTETLEEGFIEIRLTNADAPMKVGDAFVTPPTWDKLLQSFRTHVSQRETV